MNPQLFSHFRLTILSMLLAFVTLVLVAACGSSAPTVMSTQPALPTLADSQVLQTANTQLPAGTPAPAQTQAPVETQKPIPTTDVSGYTLTSACPLITRAEAEAVFGAPVKDPEEQAFPPVFSCRYYGTLNGVEGIYFIGVSVVEFPNAEQAAEVFKMAIDLNAYTEVSGLGDRAYTGGLYEITVDKGKYELSINVMTDKDKETRIEEAKALAEKALNRLP